MPIQILASPDMTRVSEAISCKSLDAESRVAFSARDVLIVVAGGSRCNFTHIDMTQCASNSYVDLVRTIPFLASVELN